MSTANVLDTITNGDSLKMKLAWVAGTTGALNTCYLLLMERDISQQNLDACIQKYDTLDKFGVQWPSDDYIEFPSETVTIDTTVTQAAKIGDKLALMPEYFATITDDGWLIVSPAELIEVGGTTIGYHFHTWSTYKRRVMVFVDTEGKRWVYDIDAGSLLGPAEQYVFVGVDTYGNRVYLPAQTGLLASALGRAIILGAIAAGIVAGIVIMKWLDIQRVKIEADTYKEIWNSYVNALNKAAMITDPNIRNMYIRNLNAAFGELLPSIKSSFYEQMLNLLKMAIIGALAIYFITSLLRR